MKDFEQLFEEVAEQIDWGKIERTMKFLEWTWFDEEVSIYSLIKTAKKRCKEAYDCAIENNESCISSSGGFHASYNPKYNELYLYFAISYGDSCDYEQ